MTAEEIIERLIDDQKITAKEAIILIKAIFGIVKEDVKNKISKLIPDSITYPINPDPWGRSMEVHAYACPDPNSYLPKYCETITTTDTAVLDNVNSSITNVPIESNATNYIK